ncbi:hypothetical protein BDF14DRAFT_1864386 [Spinellus fusiger]|nr:hypothetical protein BDF14DRAFT_1864386 [Spinellus fusiger]
MTSTLLKTTTTNMQQQIQIRTTCTTLVTCAVTICKSWAQYDATSQLLLRSLSNILSQRIASQEQAAKVLDLGSDPTQLVYKQTVAIEQTFERLHHIMNEFHSVVHSWELLASESVKLLGKSVSLFSLDKEPAPLSNESLIQTAAIRPEHAHQYIADLCSMYTKEYQYRQSLLETLPMHLSSVSQLETVLERWSSQLHIQHHVAQEMEERLKLYKAIKKTVEAVD